jgi:hypothetical protein
MNKSIRLFILVVFFVACKGESNKNTNAKSLLTMGQETELVDDIANAKPVNIKDIFLLLPNDVFLVEEISKENRALLLNHVGEDKAFDISLTPIGVCDIKNGYLNLTGSQYDWEMCYWNLRDGRKLVAVNNSTETGSKIRVFFYDDGKLTEDYNYILGGEQDYKLTDFIDISQLSSKSREYAEQQFINGTYHLYYQLPQNATSITISIDINELVDHDENYDDFYEASKNVILKWENEEWKR